jgi:chromosome segregation ATPase
MSDIQLLENQVSGLEASLAALRNDKDVFLKAQGLDEESEKARKEAEDYSTELQGIKEELTELNGRKANALEVTAEGLSAKMSQILPEGKAVFEISGDGVFIGWEKPSGMKVPYAGLSGGQKAAFDQALAFALLGEGKKILILEAAECDPIRYSALLDHLANAPDDVQLIVNAWQSPPPEIHPSWRVEVVK